VLLILRPCVLCGLYQNVVKNINGIVNVFFFIYLAVLTTSENIAACSLFMYMSTKAEDTSRLL